MSVIEFNDYKKYLAATLKTSGESRGIRSRLARHLRCQTSHISQVLRGSTHFSLEHAAQINEFLKHTYDESEYFILLLLRDRSGNRSLTKHFEKRMELIQAGHQRVKIKDTKTISSEDSALALYYSSWQNAAVHIALMRQPQSAEELARLLDVSPASILNALAVLSTLRLIKGPEANRYECLPERLHLSPNSPLVNNHHINWRLRSIQKIERGVESEALHYSGPMAISTQAGRKIRELLVHSIENMEQFIKMPGEEELCVVCVDFFPFAR